MWKNLLIIILIIGYLLYLSPLGADISDSLINIYEKYTNPDVLPIYVNINHSIDNGLYHFKSSMDYNLNDLQAIYDDIENSIPLFYTDKYYPQNRERFNIFLRSPENKNVKATLTCNFDKVNHHIYDLPGKLNITRFKFIPPKNLIIKEKNILLSYEKTPTKDKNKTKISFKIKHCEIVVSPLVKAKKYYININKEISEDEITIDSSLSLKKYIKEIDNKKYLVIESKDNLNKKDRITVNLNKQEPIDLYLFKDRSGNKRYTKFNLFNNAESDVKDEDVYSVNLKIELKQKLYLDMIFPYTDLQIERNEKSIKVSGRNSTDILFLIGEDDHKEFKIDNTSIIVSGQLFRQGIDEKFLNKVFDEFYDLYEYKNRFHHLYLINTEMFRAQNDYALIMMRNDMLIDKGKKEEDDRYKSKRQAMFSLAIHEIGHTFQKTYKMENLYIIEGLNSLAEILIYDNIFDVEKQIPEIPKIDNDRFIRYIQYKDYNLDDPMYHYMNGAGFFYNMYKKDKNVFKKIFDIKTLEAVQKEID